MIHREFVLTLGLSSAAIACAGPGTTASGGSTSGDAGLTGAGTQPPTTEASAGTSVPSTGAGSSESGQPADPLDGAEAIEAEPWRMGDAEAGYRVLLYGDNTGGGVVVELFRQLPGPPVEDVFGRKGVSAEIPWFYNAYEAPGDVTVTSPSCLSCHASRHTALDNQVVVGLGNVFEGGRLPSSFELDFVRDQLINTYGAESPEVAAFEPSWAGFGAVVGHGEPPMRGTNSAVFIEEAGFAHRDPKTFAWLDTPRFDKATAVLASDIPPWWHLKKKHALYYNGMGRGDAARLLMQSSVVATFGMAHLEQVDESMPDLLAYLLTIEAPTYPGPVDEQLAAEGGAIFTASCAPCHGTYGADETYPNLLIPVDAVGTDPAYAEYFAQPGRLVDAYNDGWYGTSGELPSRLQPELGYLAPPLDGVWATAPYFHNGSVPTLDAVLDSVRRPKAWLRDFDNHGYDLDPPGLVHEVVEPGSSGSYDTSVRGYGNGGHTFGDVLTEGERAAVVEYLKTL